jgi:putative NADH-flavin reductase
LQIFLLKNIWVQSVFARRISVRVVVFGASGRTGKLVLPALKAAGHDAVAFGRHAPEGWQGESIIAPLNDLGALAEVLKSADAAVSCLGSTGANPVCLSTSQNIMKLVPAGFRYVTVAGAAVDVPTDNKGGIDKFAGFMMKIFAGKMLAERQAEYTALAQSELAFTMLRPPQLKQGPGTGAYIFSDDKPANMQIDRADLALALVETLGRIDFIGRAPFVAKANKA